MRRYMFRVSASLCLVLSIGCQKSGQGSGQPTGPSPAVAPVVTLTALSIPDRTATVTWTAVQGATEYDVAVGTDGAVDNVGRHSVSGGATTATVTDLPPAKTVQVQVTPRNVDVTAGMTSFYLLDFRSVIDTLFFGGGPYSESRLSGPIRSVMWGWPSGSRIRILLSPETEYLRPIAEKVGAQLSDMTNGDLSAYVEGGGDNVWSAPRLGPGGTVKVVSTRDVGNVCSSTGTLDCARSDVDQGVGTNRVMLLMGPDLPESHRGPVFVHELGHALLGLVHWGGYFDAPGVTAPIACRPNTPAIQYPYLMMCGRQEPIRDGNPQALRDDFTPLEVIAAQRVYAAGLRPGASRGSFQTVGLVP